MHRLRLFAGLSILVLASAVSCGSQHQVRGSSEPDGSDPEPGIRNSVLSAVAASYRLDDQLWNERDRIHTREDLVHYFRKGFGRLQAEKLAAYFWVDDKEMPLRTGEPVLVMPEAMSIGSIIDDRAEVLLEYGGRSTGTITWEEHVIRVRLQREEGTWKIHQVEPVTRP